MRSIEFLLCLVVASAGPESAADPGARVRAVFAARCAGCHGQDVSKPKGRFGYVTDLAKVARNPELVIPGHPEESELWQLVKRGEMPLAGSPQGPLSAAEKETIRAWIAAGAPSARSIEIPASPPQRGFPAFGKFHLLVLHFPIALAIAAALGELLAWRRSLFPAPAVRFCLWLAALFAIPTVILGWLFAMEGHGSGDLLTVHAWLGTVAGVWLLLAGLAYEWASRRGMGGFWVRLLVLGAGVLTATAAHYGGLLVWGVHFFDW